MLGRTGIEVKAILGVNAVYVPTLPNIYIRFIKFDIKKVRYKSK